VYDSFLCYHTVLCIEAYATEVVVSWEEWKKKKKKKKELRIYLLQGQQGTKERIASVGNNVNSTIRTSAIGLLQHLQLLYLPS
jgi:hypothetical protein